MLPDWEGFDPAQAEQLEAAIRLGMATDPARRPQTPGELVERLRAGWSEALPTGVVTFCCSDIEGSTALWESHPEAMAEALVRHDELIADAVEARGGSLIKSMGEGDSTVSVFDSAPAAVEAALAANRTLTAEEWPPGIRIAARWGIHTGEAERRDADYYGPSVNLAARVRAQADGGEILLSSVTSELVAAHLPEGCSLVDLGPHRLKGARRAGAHPRARGAGRPDAAVGEPSARTAACSRSSPTTAPSSSAAKRSRRRSSGGSRPAGCSPSSAHRAAASPPFCAPASSPPCAPARSTGCGTPRSLTPGRRARARRRGRAGSTRRRRPVRGAVHAV